MVITFFRWGWMTYVRLRALYSWVGYARKVMNGMYYLDGLRIPLTFLSMVMFLLFEEPNRPMRPCNGINHMIDRVS
jgi:hypothetical protein